MKQARKNRKEENDSRFGQEAGKIGIGRRQEMDRQKLNVRQEREKQVGNFSNDVGRIFLDQLEQAFEECGEDFDIYADEVVDNYREFEYSDDEELSVDVFTQDDFGKWMTRFYNVAQKAVREEMEKMKKAAKKAKPKRKMSKDERKHRRLCEKELNRIERQVGTTRKALDRSKNSYLKFYEEADWLLVRADSLSDEAGRLNELREKEAKQASKKS